MRFEFVVNVEQYRQRLKEKITPGLQSLLSHIYPNCPIDVILPVGCQNNNRVIPRYIKELIEIQSCGASSPDIQPCTSLNLFIANSAWYFLNAYQNGELELELGSEQDSNKCFWPASSLQPASNTSPSTKTMKMKVIMRDIPRKEEISICLEKVQEDVDCFFTELQESEAHAHEAVIYRSKLKVLWNDGNEYLKKHPKQKSQLMPLLTIINKASNKSIIRNQDEVNEAMETIQQVLYHPSTNTEDQNTMSSTDPSTTETSLLPPIPPPIQDSLSQSQSEEKDEIDLTSSKTENANKVNESISSGSVLTENDKENNNNHTSSYSHLQPPPSIDPSLKTHPIIHPSPSSNDNNSQLMCPFQSQSEENDEIDLTSSKTENANQVNESISSGSVLTENDEENNNNHTSSYSHLQPPPSIDPSLKTHPNLSNTISTNSIELNQQRMNIYYYE